MPGATPKSKPTVIPDVPSIVVELVTAPKPERVRPVPNVGQNGHATPRQDSDTYWLGRAFDRVAEGCTRNDTGLWLACQLRDSGLSEDDAQTVMLEYADTVRHDGPHAYTDGEALASLRSAYKRAPREAARSAGTRQAKSEPARPASEEGDSTNATNAKNPPQDGGAIHAFSEYVSTPPGKMPEADPTMYYGVAGDIVGATAPESEASPVALLVQVLVCAGNVVGRKRYMQIGATRHYPNLYALLVGKTSRARKGTSWDYVVHVFYQVARDWLDKHVVTGLSSGEGIIHSLRDVTDGEDVSPGEVLRRDKRLLALESEFASVLSQATRTGNILSHVLRQGWDGVRIATLTKNSPEQATETHVSVVGHVTQAELIACMTTTDVKNGYANRFLFVATERSRLLPYGGDLDAIDRALGPYLETLRAALDWVQQHPGQARFDESARAIWPAEYRRLNEEHPGLFGDVTDRGAAHVLRLALLYAILDQSLDISADHLRAALALWKFCEASARYIFGDRLGDAIADSILEALRATPDGMTRTELYDHFGHNVSSAKIGAALVALKTAGLAYMEQKAATGEKGRPPERWKATHSTQQTQESAREPGAA
jgi:hypothetical protein